jgi:hypothetical protein
MSDTDQLPAGTTLYHCPLCEWTHAELSMSETELIASLGDPVLDVLRRRAMAVEVQVASHLSTHPLTEWAREVARLRAEIDRLSVIARSAIGAGPVAFDTAGTGTGPYPVREFTSDTGTYSIRYVPRDGVLIWTDRDYGPAACPVTEWLCVPCKTVHPWNKGDRLSRPCPRCCSAMIPTSPSVRALEELRTEVDALRRQALISKSSM